MASNDYNRTDKDIFFQIHQYNKFRNEYPDTLQETSIANIQHTVLRLNAFRQQKNEKRIIYIFVDVFFFLIFEAYLTFQKFY